MICSFRFSKRPFGFLPLSFLLCFIYFGFFIQFFFLFTVLHIVKLDVHKIQIFQGLLKFVTDDVYFSGSSLALDRGKLEAQIESLYRENESLRKKNECDNDALRIKCKIIEDQTETIGKLKAVSLILYFGKRACGRFVNYWFKLSNKYLSQ